MTDRGAGREWILRWRILAVILVPILTALIKLDIRHPERMPRTGAVIVSPNHFSDVDPVAIGFAMWRLGRVPRYLAKASLFRVPVLGGFLRMLGQIPVERGGGGNPLAAAHDLIRRGLAVVIYPEGTHTREPELWPMRGKTGAVRAALEAGVPIVPIAHWGTQRIMGRWSKKLRLLPRHTVAIAVGEPFDLSPWRDRPLDRATLQEATDALMRRIAELLGELRGEAPPESLWDPADHGQSSWGRPTPHDLEVIARAQAGGDGEGADGADGAPGSAA
ncbi:MAG: 1-acyl-sn-glycerol-3-phosphate acyltransferase [Actinomycetales bacterium]|nr:1-acyl-sn-glycerol-3-phosphate acyltransferase [Actinomycetales bacterium]